MFLEIYPFLPKCSICGHIVCNVLQSFVFFLCELLFFFIYDFTYLGPFSFSWWVWLSFVSLVYLFKDPTLGFIDLLYFLTYFVYFFSDVYYFFPSSHSGLYCSFCSSFKYKVRLLVELFLFLEIGLKCYEFYSWGCFCCVP